MSMCFHAYHTHPSVDLERKVEKQYFEKTWWLNLVPMTGKRQMHTHFHEGQRRCWELQGSNLHSSVWDYYGTRFLEAISSHMQDKKRSWTTSTDLPKVNHAEPPNWLLLTIMVALQIAWQEQWMWLTLTLAKLSTWSPMVSLIVKLER